MLAVATYFFFSDSKNETNSQFESTDLLAEYLTLIDRDEKLAGQILITTAPKSLDTHDYHNVSIELDVESGQFNDLFHEMPPYLISQRPKDGQNLFIGGRAWSGLESTREHPFGFFTTKAGYVEEVKNELLSQKDDYVHILLPRIAKNSDQYIYSYQEWPRNQVQPPMSDVSTWKIGLASMSTSSAEVLSTGYGAQWALDDQFILYVRSDGVYAKSTHPSGPTTNNMEHRIITGSFSSPRRNQLGVSADGKYLALALDSSMMDVYKLSYVSRVPQADLMIRLSLDPNEGGFWPIFSPNGRYLSIQTRNPSKGAIQSSSVKIYDFVIGQFIKQFDFSDFDFESSFNTDWVRTSVSSNFNKVE